jgi:digeranylgeranylglycerophospholipid reductase
MSDFDVIVIGGGPAGCYAGLTAAANGLKVAVFEEHGVIGWPRHDPGWLMESPFSKSVIGAVDKVVTWSKVKEYRICSPESGDIIDRSALGGYLVRRDMLEKAIAAMAIRAGAKFYLKTRVLNIVKKQDRVQGIETNSATIPEATAEVYIVADGIRSPATGFALKEGLSEEEELLSGVSYLIANAEIYPGIIEHFVSSDSLLNYRVFFTHGNGQSFFGVPYSAAFDELKGRDDNVISRKIKNAFPLEICGHSRANYGKYGQYFDNMVKHNLIFIGDASGGSGNIHGMIQGHFAGTVAASAIKEKDTSQERLREYQHLVFNTLGKAPFFWFSAIEDFGSFSEWFRLFDESTKNIETKELAGLKQ